MSSHLINVGEIGGLLGIISGISWFLWSRYQALETRLDGMEKALLKLEYSMKSLSDRVDNNHEQAMYFTGNNKALVDHRTNGFYEKIRELEQRINKQIDDLKR